MFTGKFKYFLLAVLVMGLFLSLANDDPGQVRQTSPPNQVPPQTATARTPLTDEEKVNQIKNDVAQADRRVSQVDVSVVEGRYHVNVFITLDSLWDTNSFFLESWPPMEAACRELTRFSNKIERVVFFLRGPTNNGTALYFKLFYSWSNLGDFDWAAQPYQLALNLVDDMEIKPVGASHFETLPDLAQFR